VCISAVKVRGAVRSAHVGAQTSRMGPEGLQNMKEHLEPKMVLQSDAIEEPFMVSQRTFQSRVL